MEHASPQARCVVVSEVGDSKHDYDPNTISRTNDYGIAGLHDPHGKLARFYEAGFTDWRNPYQQLAFLEAQLAADQGWAWVASRENGGWC